MATTAQERAANATLARQRHARRRRHDKVLSEIERAGQIDHLTAERMAYILRSYGYQVKAPAA